MKFRLSVAAVGMVACLLTGPVYCQNNQIPATGRPVVGNVTSFNASSRIGSVPGLDRFNLGSIQIETFAEVGWQRTGLNFGADIPPHSVH